LTVCLYTRGWRRLRNASPRIITTGCMTSFIFGILSIWAAVVSPLAALDDELLSAHMVQHLLLMAVGPPLILMGRPALPLLRGLPKSVVRSCLAPVLRSSPVRQLARIGSHSVFCWIIATTTVMGWHFPALFALGLHSPSWHQIQHGSFLLSGFVFWLPVIEPQPAIAHSPNWSVPFYLFLATLPCDALSAFLTFCGRVIYPAYLSVSRPVGISALQDQEWAGVIMWVCVTFIYMVPALVLTVRILSPERAGHPKIDVSNEFAGATRLEVR
jgi:putative membrane protein